jgi:inosose dehydratase
MTKKEQSRRRFLQVVGAGVVSLAGAGSSVAQRRRGNGQRGAGRRRGGRLATQEQFKLAMASYTFRDFSLDEALAMTKRVGLKYICLKSVHLKLDSTPEQIQAAVQKVKDAGLILYGGGVIYMRDEGQVKQAFDYAKTAGMQIIVGAPVPDVLPLVDKAVKQYDIKVAIHNHGPTDKIYPVPSTIYEKIKDLDKRIGLCMDIGHTMRAGVDPSVPAEKFADRLFDIHMKDVSEAAAKGHAVEVGRGVINIPRFIRTLIRTKYTGHVSFEYEKDAKDPLPGVAESVGYVRGVMAAV